MVTLKKGTFICTTAGNGKQRKAQPSMAPLKKTSQLGSSENEIYFQPHVSPYYMQITALCLISKLCIFPSSLDF